MAQVRADEAPLKSQRTFASLSEAVSELVRAAKAHDRQAIHEMFGFEVTNLLTGDQALDEKHFEEFSGGLAERCDVVSDGAEKATLEIGQDCWPFPIPLVKTDAAWLVAYPVRWGESGIMTFIVNQDGVVYRRSLGEKTAKIATFDAIRGELLSIAYKQ